MQEKKELPSHNAGRRYFHVDVCYSYGIIALIFLLFIFHFAMCGFAFGSAKEATESYVRYHAIFFVRVEHETT